MDPINGNDATGDFNDGPIQTIARLNSIMCGVFISAGTLTVTITSSPPISDAELDLTINYQNAIANSFFGPGQGSTPFVLLGASTNIAHAGQVATVTAAAYAIPPAVPTRGTVTDVTVADWTPFVFKPMTITSGPRGPVATGGQAGGPASAWVYAPLPGLLSTGNISQPVDIAAFPWGFLPGDSYAIINQVQVKLRQFTFIGDGTGAPRVINMYFPFWTTARPPPPVTTQSFNAVVNNFNSDCIFSGCRFDLIPGIAGQRATFAFCCLKNGYFGGSFFIIGGLINPIDNYSQDASFSTCTFTGDGALGLINSVDNDSAGSCNMFFQGVRHAGFPDAGIQFWDWAATNAAIQMGGVNLWCQAPMFGTSANARTCGVLITNGSILSLINDSGFTPLPVTPIPNLVGTGHFVTGSDGSDTDFVLDSILNGAGTPIARAWEEGTGTFTPQIPCKWTNFAVAQPAGFGPAVGDSTSRTNAQVVSSGSRIITAAPFAPQ